jgi:parallel beta-helix repeat protein
VKLKRFGWGLLAAVALSTAAVGQARPPSQRSGPITITGPGTTGDLSATTVLPPSGGQAIRLDILADRVVKLVGRPSTKNVFVASDGDDANDGFSPLAPKKTIQAGINAANPNGQVTVGAGSYTQAQTLAMQPGVRIECLPGASIIRGAAFSSNQLIDFDVNAANAASINSCVVDDNLSGNAYNVNGFAISIGNANDARVTNNSVLNSTGYGIYVRDGLRPTITGNTITRSFVAGIAVIPTRASFTVAATIDNNRLNGPLGQHAVILNNANYSSLSRNKVLTPEPTRTNVNTSGTTVTYAGSGNDFSNVYPGQFLTIDAGKEYLVTQKASNTSLTVNTTPGNLTNAPAAFGDGDLLSIANSQWLTVSGNIVSGGGAGGIVASNFIASAGKAQDLAFNNISGNVVTLSGHSCISIQGTTTDPVTQVYDNSITSNNVNRCALAGVAGSLLNRTGISVFDFTGAQRVSRTTIAANTSRDDLGDHLYGINLFGIGNGQVFAGNNSMSGASNPGIGGGVSGVTLGAQWGSAASASAITSYGGSFSLTITSAGTGQGNGPLAYVATPATSLEQPPIRSCKMVAGSGAFATLFGEQNADASQQIFGYNGTPVAGQTYTVFCR